MSGGRKRRCSTWLALADGPHRPPGGTRLGFSGIGTAIQPGHHLRVLSANPSAFGQDVMYTATLTTSDWAPQPGDTIEFQDDGNDIVNCNAQPFTSIAPPGTYTATCVEPEVPFGRRPPHYGGLPRRRDL